MGLARGVGFAGATFLRTPELPGVGFFFTEFDFDSGTRTGGRTRRANTSSSVCEDGGIVHFPPDKLGGSPVLLSREMGVAEGIVAISSGESTCNGRYEGGEGNSAGSACVVRLSVLSMVEIRSTGAETGSVSLVLSIAFEMESGEESARGTSVSEITGDDAGSLHAAGTETANSPTLERIQIALLIDTT